MYYCSLEIWVDTTLIVKIITFSQQILNITVYSVLRGILSLYVKCVLFLIIPMKPCTLKLNMLSSMETKKTAAKTYIRDRS